MRVKCDATTPQNKSLLAAKPMNTRFRIDCVNETVAIKWTRDKLAGYVTRLTTIQPSRPIAERKPIALRIREKCGEIRTTNRLRQLY
jgi:hypothetical protein